MCGPRGGRTIAAEGAAAAAMFFFPLTQPSRKRVSSNRGKIDIASGHDFTRTEIENENFYDFSPGDGYEGRGAEGDITIIAFPKYGIVFLIDRYYRFGHLFRTAFRDEHDDLRR